MIILITLLLCTTLVQAESIEDIITQATDTCERITKPKSQASCPLQAKKSEATVKPQAALKRCDPNREDEPATADMDSYLNAPMPVSSLSEEEAQEVFKNFAARKRDLALNEERTGAAVCAQRAQILATQLLSECKIRSAKVFLWPGRDWRFAGLSANTLAIEAKGKTFQWARYHVANVIYVNKGGKNIPYVLDPLLYDQAVPLQEWTDKFIAAGGGASTRITSGATYRWANDEPVTEGNPAPSSAQALSDLEKYRRDSRTLQKLSK